MKSMLLVGHKNKSGASIAAYPAADFTKSRTIPLSLLVRGACFLVGDGLDRYLFPVFSDEVEAVVIHHFGPRSHEVLHELLFCVPACIDFRERAQLRVRTACSHETARSLTFPNVLALNGHFGWGRGAVGSAPRWHRGGRGFESHRLHQLFFQLLTTTSKGHQFRIVSGCPLGVATSVALSSELRIC